MSAPDLTTKIQIQEKIAELERRIVDLETRMKGHRVLIHERAFGSKWREMWKAFDKYFDEVFK